ncbi:MAG TPA: hypothetical protein VIM17_09760 [Jatrophihabitantaceae bacterium]|jgi:hypothetical protein
MPDDLRLNAAQLANARALIGAVKARRLPRRAAVIIIETAIVESSLQIYANSRG